MATSSSPRQSPRRGSGRALLDNAQTQEDIQRANAGTIEDISRNVAGLQVQNLGPGQSQVSVRGVPAGQIVRDQPGVKEQVGVYLDESIVSLSLFTPDFDLFDLNRVETLRGPQGTLFGSDSVGGTIRYITNQPRTDRTGPFSWVLGGFYSMVDREYTQRLPTPGYDAATDATLGAGTSAPVRNGFPANSPTTPTFPATSSRRPCSAKRTTTLAWSS
ncbi:TonB-dependent receptor plug domain-containing protein [Sphingomonas sp. LHG3443-2]|uniref:TonB-dependent receptor plug domain-containing protein n=1 Tax=Sphingomonas sp. LHG3443-2 TaxID=2804639 RepID=UPI003CF575BA